MSDFKVTHIDADSLLYQAAWVAEKDSNTKEQGFQVYDELVAAIAAAVGAERALTYISDVKCFRHAVHDQYKANRKDRPVMPLLAPIKEYAKRSAVLASSFGRVEADDALGLAYDPDTDILAHLDKDLDQLPGMHYNYTHKQFYTVSQWEGIRYFWLQMLTGDRADNIAGIHRLGPVGAKKVLADCTTPLELELAVIRRYQEAFPDVPNDQIATRLHQTASLLWIQRAGAVDLEEWKTRTNNGQGITNG